MTRRLGRRSAVVGSWLAFTGVATAVGLAAVDLVADPLQATTAAGQTAARLSPGGDLVPADDAAPDPAPQTTTATSSPTSSVARKAKQAKKQKSTAAAARAGGAARSTGSTCVYG